MNRPLIFGAAFAATTLLVMSGGSALANAPAPLPITGVGEAGAAAAPVVEPPSEPAGTPATPAPSGGAAPELSVPPPATEPPAPATPAESPVVSSPAPSGGEGATLADPEVQTSPSDSPADAAEAVHAISDGVAAPATARVPATVVASDSGAPAIVPSGDPRPAPAAGQSGVILERLLPQVERKLRGVQTQMDDLQRRLAVGATPPARSLVRLRRSLELIAPALAALGAQADSSGALSPHLRHLLHRVNKRLDGAHVSAGALAAALRRSGMHGPEVALLLRELEGFRTDGPVLSPVARLTGSSALYAADVAYKPAPAPATVTAPAQHASPQREGAVHPATTSPNSPAPDELVRQLSASGSGSASAGPGGALSAAGAAALAALLGALALPRLLTRVQLMTARSYKAAFLVPLQRPG